MRLISATAVVFVALAILSPSYAQYSGGGEYMPPQGYPPPGYGPQGMPPGGVPPQGGMSPQGGRREAMRACMAPYRQAIHQQVRAHMRQWQSANPGAGGEAAQAERHALVHAAAQPYVQQCRAQFGGRPPMQGGPGPYGPGGYGPGTYGPGGYGPGGYGPGPDGPGGPMPAGQGGEGGSF